MVSTMLLLRSSRLGSLRLYEEFRNSESTANRGLFVTVDLLILYEYKFS